MTFTASLPWSERRRLPEVSAVYGLHTAEGELLYVGKSTRLRQRMIQHHRAKQIPLDGEIRWMEVEPSLLDELEQRLINLLSPPLNDTRLPNPRFALILSNPETKAKMERLAAENLRTVSAEIEMACRHWIKQHEGQAPQD